MQVELKTRKIILAGGGSGGPVAPLLAVAEDLVDYLNKPKPAASPLLFGNAENSPERNMSDSQARGGLDFLWLGTFSGPEKDMVAEKGIRFKAIHSGKFRRYFSVWNLIDPILILIGIVESLFIIRKYRPDLILSVGGFVSVPVVWAGWVLRVPVMIHQQDICPGLANKLMAPFAKIITVTFEKSLKDYGAKAIWVGNPVRADFRRMDFTTETARTELNLRSDKPVITIIGGGTGAAAINNLVWGNLNKLTDKYQIIHITGAGKNDPEVRAEDYHQYEFLRAKILRMAFDLSSAVVSRCGLAVLTELSYLGKPSILIPMPDSHQEDNAAIYFEQKAAIVLDQNELTADKLLYNINLLVTDFELRSRLRNNIKNVIKKGANERFVEIINKII